MENAEVKVTGTLMWYYHICQRQVWLMARQLIPEKDHTSLELGRFLQETAYSRNRKEVTVGHLKFDLIRKRDGQLVVGEVKKSSRYEKCNDATFFIYELKSWVLKHREAFRKKRNA